MAAAPTPEALAGAWLAQIPPSQLAAAHAHTDVRIFAWFGGLALLLAICVLAARVRLLPRLAGWAQASEPRPMLTAMISAAALALALAVPKAVFDAGAGVWGDGVLAAGGGAPPGPGFAVRLQAALSGVVPVTLAAILFTPPTLWLMRRLPRAWPLALGAALTAVILVVGWAPYGLALGPALPSLPQGPLRAALAPLVATARLPARDILADPDPGSLTDVTGGLGQARVVVGADTAGDTPDEARAYLGHLIGHYAHADILIVALVVAAVLTLGAVAAQRWAAPLARRLAGEAAAPHEPAALPAIAMIAILAVAAAGLAGAAYLRWANVRADDYSLDLAREPDGLASVLVKEWDHASVDPDLLGEAIFYTHPPLKDRLIHAMAWKTTHGG